jgi:ATP-dependent Clp protease ATP-binding subunit ClpA
MKKHATIVILLLTANLSAFAASDPPTPQPQRQRVVDLPPKKPVDRFINLRVQPTDLLETITDQSLRDQVEHGPHIYGQERQVVLIENANSLGSQVVVIAGGDKSGKSALATAYFMSQVDPITPGPQQHWVRVRLNTGKLMKPDPQHPNQALSNMEGVISFIRHNNLDPSKPKMQLYIEKLSPLLAESSTSPAEALIAGMKAGDIPMLIESDKGTLADKIMKDKDLAPRLTIVEDKAPGMNAILSALKDRSPQIEKEFGVKFSDHVLSEVARLTAKFGKKRTVQEGLDLLKEVALNFRDEKLLNRSAAGEWREKLRQKSAELRSNKYYHLHDGQNEGEESEINLNLESEIAKLKALIRGSKRMDALERDLIEETNLLIEKRIQLEQPVQSAQRSGLSALFSFAKSKSTPTPVVDKAALEIEIKRLELSQIELAESIRKGKSVNDQAPKDLTAKLVHERAAEKFNQPEILFSDAGETAIDNLPELLNEYIVGQDGAKYQLRELLKPYKAGQIDPSGMIGNMLFGGPAGVGKTELARKLALVLGMQIKIVKMDSFQSELSTNRIGGSEKGYVGYGEDTLADDLEALGENSIVIFDEADKAHAAVWKALTSAMTDGFIEKSNGVKKSVRGQLWIFTINKGNEFFPKLERFQEEAPTTDDEKQSRQYRLAELNLDESQTAKLKNAVGMQKVDLLGKLYTNYLTFLDPNKYTPELMDRFDQNVVTFHALSAGERALVVEMRITDYANFVHEHYGKNVNLVVTNEVVSFISEELTSGARAINKIINRKFTSAIYPIAKDLKGASITIVMDYDPKQGQLFAEKMETSKVEQARADWAKANEQIKNVAAEGDLGNEVRFKTERIIKRAVLEAVRNK